MRSGLSQTEAADEIARDKKLHALAGKKAGKFPATAINWRQEFRKKRVKNLEAADLFAEGVRQIDELVGDRDALRELAAAQLNEARSGC
jgi:hypothetical protein